MTTVPCPICRADNSSYLFFCNQCGAELTGQPTPLASKPIVKYSPDSCLCPRCKASNQTGLFLCSECGQELAPCDQSQNQALTLVIAGRTYPCVDGDILGRSGTVAPDFFKPIVTVSRKHISVHWHDGKWWIRVGTVVGNLTELDGRSLTPGSETALESEHRLRLSRNCEVILRISSA